MPKILFGCLAWLEPWMALLGVGGWHAVKGQIEVGTVVAFVSGLAKVNDPWGDIVNWFREMTVVGMRYRLVADAMRWLAREAG